MQLVVTRCSWDAPRVQPPSAADAADASEPPSPTAAPGGSDADAPVEVHRLPGGATAGRVAVTPVPAELAWQVFAAAAQSSSALAKQLCTACAGEDLARALLCAREEGVSTSDHTTNPTVAFPT